MHKQQEIVMLPMVHPRVFEAVLLLPCLTNKAVSTVYVGELFGLIVGVDDDPYIYCLKLRIIL